MTKTVKMTTVKSTKIQALVNESQMAKPNKNRRG